RSRADRALVPAHGARGGRPAAGRGRRRARRLLPLGADRQPAHALGLVLDDRRHELQLAPAARPAGDPRLRRLARGLPPRPHGPLPALLVPPRAPPAGLPHIAPLAQGPRRDARPGLSTTSGSDPSVGFVPGGLRASPATDIGV